MESYFETDIEHLPIERVVDSGGKPVHVHVETRSGVIVIGLWQAQVGRSELILLDSDVAENSESDRELTGRLYAGDMSVRVRQELILGLGGARALAALNIRPAVIHLNEGHSAFALIEFARQEMVSDAVPFSEAVRRVAMRTVFTTHTPVESGHDRFDEQLLEETLGPLIQELEISGGVQWCLEPLRP